jgi:hypothetical protein
VTWGFHHMNVGEAGLLGCCSMWLGHLTPKFQIKNAVPSSSGLWVRPQGYESICRFVTLKMKVTCSFEMSIKKITQPNGTTTPKTWFRNIKTGLQLIKSSSTVSFPVGKAATFLCYTSRILHFSILSLSLTCYISDKKVCCYDHCFIYI